MVVNLLANAALYTSLGVFASSIIYRLARRTYRSYEIQKSCEVQKEVYRSQHTHYEWNGYQTADSSLIQDAKEPETVEEGRKIYMNARALSELRRIN